MSTAGRGAVSMTVPVRVGLAKNDADLSGILALQRANLRTKLTPEQASREGFVSLVHTLEVLQQMHALAPSVVAWDGADVVGYALSLPFEARALVPGLAPMFEELGRLEWRGAPLTPRRCYVMGQVCVARELRGTGVFAALYAEHDASYGARFECMVTEVSCENPRSLRAHAKVGFERLVSYGEPGKEWQVLVRPLELRTQR